MLDSLVAFSGSAMIEGVHPLQFGFVRRKVRTQRRYGMPIVNPLIFYPWRVCGFVSNALQAAKVYRCKSSICPYTNHGG